MKKTQRICIITHILTENPNRDFSLGTFAEQFGCAKSSISDDIKLVREAIDAAGLGYLETTSGAKGGVRYVPYISRRAAAHALEELRKAFEDPSRMLGSGFVYTSDIMFNPKIVRGAAMVFAKKFASAEADLVVTVETKGIGVALFTAQMLNIPLAVIRHESKVSEGSSININYFSGSADRLQQMSISKKGIPHGSRVLIIDDFMRGGGSILGILNMLKEFDAQPVGTGVVIVAGGRENKKIPDYVPLLILNDQEDGRQTVEINLDMLTL
ncbi:MAG: pur operon repressor [Firmicutes bacterium]|nr:pur operon repressor [Bacillota bacterium]MBR6969804.1 pur operon repressor [Bacillota bacterium]